MKTYSRNHFSSIFHETVHFCIR